jgi:DNA repair protein RecN (Recombination protein N)
VPVLHHDARLRALDDRLVDLASLVTDLGADLGAYLADIELEPERLEQVQHRRAALATLTRKYGETIEEVLLWSQQSAARLDELLTADDRVVELDGEVAALEAELVAASVELSRLRHTAAAGFGKRVTAELRHLAMGRAELVVEVTPRADESGAVLPSGERVRLGPLGFDEVDAGVGGRAALDVGARLARLAEHAQVIVVTHLAQVAAFADRHLVVRKSDDGVITSSSVTVVEDEARLSELSRMMGGDPDSDAGLAHARDLLAQTSAMQRVPSH